jgi:SAM-dependent methyltransferase
MNEAHLRLCSSPEWRAVVEEEILPNAVGDRSLGEIVLEVGAGPGLTTDAIRQIVPNLTAVELDEELAAKLAARFAGTNVEVVCADATGLPFEDDLFSSALTFTCSIMCPQTSSRTASSKSCAAYCARAVCSWEATASTLLHDVNYTRATFSTR